MNYFDLHCDTISRCFLEKTMLDKNHLQLSLDKGKNLNKWVQTYAIWIDDELEENEAYDYFNNVYDFFLQQISYNKSRIKWCTSGKKIQKYLEDGYQVAILAVEGSRALGGNINNVNEFYSKGIRMMTLTWNGKCRAGDGCMVDNAEGLTLFGKNLVKKMDETGMIIDVSHLSEKGFYNVAELTTGPFVATHSNSREICSVARNLTDQQFKVITERKGIVGMNFYPLFINGTKKAHIKELFAHIDHFLELGGEDYIAIGSDFDGAKMPQDLKNVSKLELLNSMLSIRYGKNIAEKITYSNALRFFEENI